MIKRFRKFAKYYMQNKAATLCFILLLILIVLSIFADFISPYDFTKQDVSNTFLSPSPTHLMGTDNFGRDEFSRILHGGQMSLLIGISSTFFSIIIGLIIGLFAGYYGGKFDVFAMRVMDIFLSIPQLILAIALAATLGNGIFNLILALSLSSTPKYARLIRAKVIEEKNLEYVTAARILGENDLKIIFFEILPNSLGPIIVEATIGVGVNILSSASLSFIGMGIEPPQAEWGQMLSEGRTFIRDYPFLTVFPGLAICISILLFNLVGDGLRDAFDPKKRG
ncbi:ABC transporter permease [Peptoniphilus lacrimalis]|uniref:ABC transporter, permease protein n=1 Tax=Peptoniphilus lacrimalis 315-B TaxID=596330 RepID=D1VVB2_9FIRM|nr:ABC transporter permease [Peptoniphilus lacrimalis]EFA89470.1 ABC transporter, permease protein [Peptoniphilus lacrimalis 315-B]